MNSELTKLLLPKDKIMELHSLIRVCEREYEVLNSEFLLLSKYHQRLWFQKVMMMSLDEMLTRMKVLAKLIEALERDVNNARTVVHDHYATVEILQGSMKPYSNNILEHIELTQSELF